MFTKEDLCPFLFQARGTMVENISCDFLNCHKIIFMPKWHIWGWYILDPFSRKQRRTQTEAFPETTCSESQRSTKLSIDKIVDRQNHRDRQILPHIMKWLKGEINGNLLSYCCLENPMDRGGWRATGLHRVRHNWTRTHRQTEKKQK